MGKIAILGIGLLFVGLGVAGSYNAVASWDKEPQERSDIETTGIVTEVTVTELKHAVGVTLDRSYEMEFQFQAEDGKTYHGEETINEVEAKALREGQEVKVKYHSNNPDINAAVNFGHYYGVDTFEPPSSQNRLLFSLGALGFGALLTVCGFKCGG